MTTIMLWLAIAGFVVFFIHRRQIDFVTVGFVGMMIYFSPGFYGYVTDPYNPAQIPSVPIYNETYYVWFGAIGAIIASGIIYNPQRLPPEQTGIIERNKAFDYALIGCLIGSFLLWYYTAGGAIFSDSKSVVLENSNRFSILFGSLMQLGAVAFLIQRRWLLALIPAAAGAFLLYAGFRSDVALSMIAVATFYAHKQGLKFFLKPQYALPVLFLSIVMLTYKPFLVAYRTGHVEVVANLLGNQDYLQQAILGSEPFLAQATLNEIIGRGFVSNPVNFVYSLAAIVPFLLPVLGVQPDEIAFNFQEELFPHIPYGLGSNIYGNFYAAFGVTGIILFIALHSIVLIAISRAMTRAGPIRTPILLMWGAFFGFYIHRNDVLNSLAFFNRPIIALILVYIVSRLTSVSGLRPAAPTPSDLADHGTANWGDQRPPSGAVE